ncbi:MAG TPA: helix-turn-helix domain-containing protein [Streptosporangiaceae bacterium]|jgi:sugar-specific transcriptional regulator TrmB/DNA-binding CsgD family transcriptional regulator
MLETFGIDHYAEQVYLALLDQPTARAVEIAGRLGISQQDVHDALDELSRLSLVRPSWENPGTVRPVSPDIGLECLLARQEAELLQRQNQLESSRGVIAALAAQLPAEPDEPADADITQVHGLDAIRVKLEQLAYETQHQLLSLMPGGPQSRDNMAASRPLDEMLLARGVEILTVYLDSVSNEPHSRQYVKWLTDSGGQVRTTTTLPLRLLICDRKVAIVPLIPDRSEVGIAILRGDGPVTAMCVLFDQIWQGATPFGEARTARDDPAPTQQELAVVRLLAQGYTDEIISRKLGVSPRTAGRLASDLMSKLGARSRFQAGVRAAERGWHLRPAHPAQPPGTAKAP